MKENIIYFAMGFKSYEIERRSTNAEDWFGWTERGRNFIRTAFSKKTMVWLCENLKEASREKGNYVKIYPLSGSTSGGDRSLSYQR